MFPFLICEATHIAIKPNIAGINDATTAIWQLVGIRYLLSFFSFHSSHRFLLTICLVDYAHGRTSVYVPSHPEQEAAQRDPWPRTGQSSASGQTVHA